MSVDLALDYATHDLVIAPNGSIDVRTGQSTVEQRMRVRLWIIKGQWDYDPTDGRLGSTLHDTLRMPIDRAVQEIPLVVREALEDMTDIEVQDVICVPDPDSSRAVMFTILYSVLGSDEVLSTTLGVAG